MMKKNDIQKNEIAISRNVKDFNAKEKIEEMKKEISKMQNNKQKKNEAFRL